jgi:hypothetical protein
MDPMTREKLRAELVRELSALDRLFADYVIVTRVFVDEHLNEVGRITRGAFRRRPREQEEKEE